MTFAPIAFEITDTGLIRELDAYETACALADIRRWREKPAASRQPLNLRRFSPDRMMLGSVLGAFLTVTVALCQIAGAI
jgi:hypothetical protein